MRGRGDHITICRDRSLSLLLNITSDKGLGCLVSVWWEWKSRLLIWPLLDLMMIECSLWCLAGEKWLLSKNVLSCSNASGEGNGTPLQHSCLKNPMDRGAWWAAVHGVAKSQTRLSKFPFTFHFHALEKAMATHSSVLAWRIPGTGLWGHTETWLKWLSSSSSSISMRLILSSLPFYSYWDWAGAHGT